MNKVQILATITRDIEIKYAQSGTAIASFGIAWNDKRKQADGSYQDVAHFFDCTAFGRTGEIINQFFRKGSRILIDGSLQYQSWTAQDGSKKSKVGIIVNAIDFIDKKQDGNTPKNPATVQAQKQTYEDELSEDIIPF